MNLRVELLTGGIGRPAEPSLPAMMDSQRETEGRSCAIREATLAAPRRVGRTCRSGSDAPRGRFGVVPDTKFIRVGGLP